MSSKTVFISKIPKTDHTQVLCLKGDSLRTSDNNFLLSASDAKAI